MSRSSRVRGVLLLGLAVVLTVTTGSGLGAGPRTPTGSLTIRESAAMLTADQRRDYVEAVLELKHTPSIYRQDRAKGWSWYDTFVHWHMMLDDCGATDLDTHPRMLGHDGPMFLPWHREYLHLFQQALSTVSHHPVPIPYWDWTDPSTTDRGDVKAVFSPDFMGPDGNPADGYAVDSGPFTRATWPLVLTTSDHGLISQYTSPSPEYLSRHLGDPAALPTVQQASNLLSITSYDTPPYDDRSDPATSFRQALEGHAPAVQGEPVSSVGCAPDRPATPTEGTMGFLPVPAGPTTMHNAVHTWTGGSWSSSTGTPLYGTMSPILTSPNDPVFFLHHAEVDRLWALWQARHGTQSYEPTAEKDYPYNALHSPMYPFDVYGIEVTPAEVLDTRELGYVYAAPAYDPSAGTASVSGKGRHDLAALASAPSWWCT